MNLQTSERNRSPKLRRGDLISVDYYKSDDMEMSDWVENNTDDGIGVKCIDYNDESYLLWIEDCPYAIDPSICYKD